VAIVEGWDDVRPIRVAPVLHEPPVKNPGLLDPEEGLHGPSEAVLVSELGHKWARHLSWLRSSAHCNSGSLATKTVLGKARVVPEIMSVHGTEKEQMFFPKLLHSPPVAAIQYHRLLVPSYCGQWFSMNYTRYLCLNTMIGPHPALFNFNLRWIENLQRDLSGRRLTNSVLGVANVDSRVMSRHLLNND